MHRRGRSGLQYRFSDSIDLVQRQQVENSRLIQRLVGAGVIIVLVVIFLPAMFDDNPSLGVVSEEIPPHPKWEFVAMDPHLDTGIDEIEGTAPISAELEAEAPQQPDDAHDSAAETPAGSLPEEAGAPPELEQAREPVADLEVSPGPPPVAEALAEDGGHAHHAARQPAVEEPSAADEAAAKDADGEGQWHEVKVRRGDSLYGIFKRLGLTTAQLKEVTSLNRDTAKLSHLRPGQRFRLRIDTDGRLRELIYLRSGDRRLHLARGSAGWESLRPGKAPPPSPAPPKAEARPVPAAKLDSGTTRTKATVADAWVVQLASLSKQERATALRDRLRSKGYAAFLKPAYVKGEKVWRVKVGPELKRSRAADMRTALERDVGLTGLIQAYP
jgi:DedD protein